MSAQLFNPQAKKFVNVSEDQMETLRKAGWLDPTDEKVVEILNKAKEDEGKEPSEEEKAEALKKKLAEAANKQ